MQELTSWLTPALVIALFAWLRADLRELRREMSSRFNDVNGRFDAVNGRFDDVNNRIDENGRQIGDLRERMAKLEGALEGFLAGRRDRDAA